MGSAEGEAAYSSRCRRECRKVAAGGRIENSQDVVRRLDELCEYYAKNEPSSPIPLLLERAKRLVDKSFLDLLNDLAPGGVSELQVVSGRTDDE